MINKKNTLYFPSYFLQCFKKYHFLLVSLLILINFYSCKKKDVVACSFFPLHNQQEIIYKKRVVSTNVSSEYRAQAISDISLKIDKMIFSVRDCQTGKINLSYDSLANGILIFNKDSIDNSYLVDKPIYSDALVTVLQKNNGGEYISALIQKATNKTRLIVYFKPGIGVSVATEFDATGRPTIDYHP